MSKSFNILSFLNPEMIILLKNKNLTKRYFRYKMVRYQQRHIDNFRTDLLLEQ